MDDMDEQKYCSLRLANQLCFPLYACSKEITRAYKPFLDQLDLTYTQYITMMVLWEKKKVNVKMLGDSLFLDSYALIAEAALPSQIKVNLIAELSLAAGTFGMVGGQVLDMQGEGKDISLAELQNIHANKTGKLLTYPFIAAGLIAEVAQPQQEKLRKIGQLLGLAFQVRDDILDITANFEELGKTPQKDVAAEKATYPAILGLNGAKRFFEEQLEETEHLLAEVEAELAFSGAAIRKIIESLKLNDERKSRCSSL